MVKRRKARRAHPQHNFSRKKKVGRRSKKSGNLEQKLIVGGLTYGTVREQISKLLAPLASKLPAGQYTDEFALGLTAYLAAKGKIPLVNNIKQTRDIGKAGLTIESYRLGEDAIAPRIFNKMGTGIPVSSGVPVV